MPAAPKAKPLITANQVTFARLALLPFGSWLMYQGHGGQWAALFFMTVVGCTDFVDGWLARKYGPTVLGGLMDPIADKVFVAVTYLPMIDLGWLPWYIVCLLFIREFLVTAARTAYERRKVSLKTSYLAKVKTWFQMCGCGLIFLFRTVERPWVMNVIVIAIFAIPVLGGIVYYLVKRKVWRGTVVWFFCWGVLAGAQVLLSVKFGKDAAAMTAVGVGWAALAITYLSGGAYLAGMRDLPGTGRIDMHDVARLFGAIALPALAAPLIALHAAPAWPVITAVSFEFGIGGLDNLMAHNKQLPSWAGWLVRVGAQAICLGAALYLALTSPDSPLIFPLELATLAVTAAATAVVFFRNRRVYLGDLELIAPETAADAPN